MNHLACDVSVVFVNYKTNKLTLNAVKSIKQKEKNLKYEIIVVDNSSDILIFNDLKEKLLDIDDQIQVINSYKNVGFGNANNLGAKIAKGKYLLFLNTDTLLINNAITQLSNYLNDNENVGVVGPNIYDINYNPSHSFCLYEKNIDFFNLNYGIATRIKAHILKKRCDFNHTHNPLEINGYVCGACLMIRKELFEKIGGFDRDIFMYAEETLLCFYVIHNFNYKIFNLPNAKIMHLEGQSDIGFSEKKLEMMVEGNSIYLRKAFGLDSTIIYLKKDQLLNRLLGVLKLIISFDSNNYFFLLSKVEKRKIKELKRNSIK